MISVVIPTLNDLATLPAALEALLKATIDGLVKQVIIADGGSTDATVLVAEDCGADLIEGPGSVGARLAAGCARARADWVMLLPPAPCLIRRWDADVKDFLEGEPGPGVRLTSGAWPWSAVQGVLVRRKVLETAGGVRDVRDPQADLSRRSGLRRRLAVGLPRPGARR